MKYITWDIGILAAVALLVTYTILFRRNKSLATLVSVYIAYVVTSVWGEQVVGLFTGDRVLFNQVWFRTHASPFVVQSVLFVLVALLLSAFVKLGGRRSSYSIPEVTVYAVATVGLAVMLILSFAPADLRDSILAGSKVTPFLYHWREWVLVAPVLLMLFFGIYNNDGS